MTKTLTALEAAQDFINSNGQAKAPTIKPQQPIMLNAALKHAKCGWHVFPCHVPIFNDVGACVGCTCEEWKRTQAKFGPDYKCPQPGKCPAVRWSEKSTNDMAQIRKWWIRKWKSVDVETGTIVYYYPNIGIDCGPSGLIVLDEDAYKQVYGDLGDLLSPDEQETVKQLSGSHQGSHLLYAMPEGKAYGNETGELPDGLDVRGVGGYIIVEPSLHKSGNRYEWIEGYGPDEMNLQTLPQPLQTILDAAQEKSTKNKTVTFTEATTEAPDMARWHISKDIRQLIDKAPAVGERSEADYKVCLSLCYAGATDDDILAVFEHNPIGKDGKFAESGKRYLSLTISKARAYMDEHPRTTVDIDVTPAEKPIVLADLLDEIQADTDKHALKAWAIDNALRCSKLDLMDVARLKAELSRLKVPGVFLDREWPQLMNAAKAEAQKKAAPAAPKEMVELLRYKLHENTITEVREKYDKNGDFSGLEYIPLANFVAMITANVSRDDGEVSSLNFAIDGVLHNGKPLPEILIKADEFESMKWPVKMWGAEVSVEVGEGMRERLRHGIQWLSERATIANRKVYTHTGWRVIDGNRVFLHAGGAVGAAGVSVELDNNLKFYTLPDDAVISEREAMIESLKLLDIAPAHVSYPIWAAMFTAPLSEIIEPAYLINIEGQTGSLKTSYTAICLNHFGEKFNEHRTPADWMSTAGSLEKQAFLMKDFPFLIDDFRPSSNRIENQKMQDSLARIARAVGNRAGRGRLDGSTEFHRTFIPRGLVLSTAERGAVGMSVNARMMTVTIEPGDVDPVKLAEAQGQRHVYGYAMRGYIEAIAKDWDDLKVELPKALIHLRAQAQTGGHKRLPEATASLYLGFNLAMNYAADIGAITHEEMERRCSEYYDVLNVLAERQSANIKRNDPALQYLQTVITLIAQGKAHIKGKGKLPDMGGIEYIGWHDSETVYLMPAAFNLVCQYVAKEGSMFPSDENTLKDELRRQEYTVKVDKGRKDTLQRVPGKAEHRERVIAVDMAKFLGVASDTGFELADLYTPFPDGAVVKP